MTSIINPVNDELFGDRLYYDAATQQQNELDEIDLDDLDSEKLGFVLQRIIVILGNVRAQRYAELSDLARREWLATSREQSAQISPLTNYEVTAVQLGKLLINGMQIANAQTFNKEAFDTLTSYQNILDIAKTFLETLDHGKRTEFETKIATSKMFFDVSSREQGNAEQETLAALRKIDEWLRGLEALKSQMARNGG